MAILSGVALFHVSDVAHWGVLRYEAGFLLQENEPEVRPEKVNMGLC